MSQTTSDARQLPAGPIASAEPAARTPGWSFALLLTCLVLEYGRPQSLIGGLSTLRLPGVSTVLVAISLLVSGRVQFDLRPTRLFLGMLALMAIHVPLATNNYWAFEVLKTMTLVFVVYLALVTFMDTPGRLRMLIAVWLGVHVFLAYRGLQLGGRGVGGFLGDENDLALTLNMAIPIPVLLGMHAGSARQRFLYFGIALLLVVAQITTLSRGGFVGLVAVAGFILWRSRKKVALLAALTILGLLAIQFAPTAYFDEIRSLRAGTADDTATGRIYMWRISWRMFLDHPIVGVGQGNGPWRFREYEIASGNEAGLHGRSRAGRASHSLYFTLLPELGLLGAALYVGLVTGTWRTLRRIERSAVRPANSTGPGDQGRRPGLVDGAALAIALQASLVGFLVSGVFLSVLYYPNFWILVGFAYALAGVPSGSDGNRSAAH